MVLPSGAIAPLGADRIYHGVPIYSMSAPAQAHEAIAVRDG